MAPSDFGPKMRMMAQKAFWMHTKTYFTFTTNRMNPGSSVAFKAEDLGKAKGKDAVEKAAAETMAVGGSLNLYPEDHCQFEDWSWQTEEPWWWQDRWASQPDAADSWQSWDQESAHELAESYTSKGNSRKGKKGKKGEDGKDKKGSSNVASSQSEAQTAVEAPSLPASFFAMHHVGSPINVGEPEMRGNLWRPGPHDGGPDAYAEHPEIPFDDEPDDAAQDVADEEGVSTPSGSSLHSEVPHLHHDWVWYPVVRSGATRQHLDPESEAIGVGTFMTRISMEYGSYFYTSIATPRSGLDSYLHQ